MSEEKTQPQGTYVTDVSLDDEELQLINLIRAVKRKNQELTESEYVLKNSVQKIFDYINQNTFRVGLVGDHIGDSSYRLCINSDDGKLWVYAQHGDKDMQPRQLPRKILKLIIDNNEIEKFLKKYLDTLEEEIQEYKEVSAIARKLAEVTKE